MVVKSFGNVFESPVSAVRMFKAGVVDSHNLVPKLIPQIITSIKIIKGEGDAPLVKRTEFTDLIPFGYTMDRIDVLDEEKFVFKYWLLEGGRKGKLYKNADYEVKFEPANDGGCVCKIVGNYHAFDDVEITDEETKLGKEGLTVMYKAVEAYLLANPDAYA